MKPARVARELFDEAYLSNGDEFDPSAVVDLGAVPADRLVDLLEATADIRRAAARVTAAVETELADRLGEGGQMRVGENLYRYRRKTYDRVQNIGELVRWLADDWHLVVPVTESARLRKGGLDHLAELRPPVDPETGEVLDPRERFLRTEEGEPALETIPIDKAPKYAAALPEGEVRQKRLPKGA